MKTWKKGVVVLLVAIGVASCKSEEPELITIRKESPSLPVEQQPPTATGDSASKSAVAKEVDCDAVLTTEDLKKVTGKSFSTSIVQLAGQSAEERSEALLCLRKFRRAERTEYGLQPPTLIVRIDEFGNDAREAAGTKGEAISGLGDFARFSERSFMGSVDISVVAVLGSKTIQLATKSRPASQEKEDDSIKYACTREQLEELAGIVLKRMSE